MPRTPALLASVVVHAALAAAWVYLAPRSARERPPPSQEHAVEVRLFQPRVGLGSPRTAGPRREAGGEVRLRRELGHQGRAPRAASAPRRAPASGLGRVGGAPGPAPIAAPERLLVVGRGAGDRIAFSGGSQGEDALAGAGAWRGGVGRSGQDGDGGGFRAPPSIDADWLERHRRAIERRLQFTMNTLPYPPDARRRRANGWVVVVFRLGTDGRVRDVRVTKSSGHASLDRCAVEAVVVTPRFPRPPVELEVEVPFWFRLLPG